VLGVQFFWGAVLRRWQLVTVTALAAVLGGLVVPAANAGPRPSGQESLLRAIDRLMAMPGGPPGLVVVLQHGSRPVVVSAGVAKLGTSRPPAATQHMRVASVSKAYSGAVALALVDRGVLSLHDTIGTLLPSLPRAWSRVTLGELLQHTSGLPNFTASAGYLRLLQRDPHGRIALGKLLGLVAHKPLQFPPGSRYEYDNSDNVAAALMSESATGRSYDRLLRTLIFGRLGLTQTSLPAGFGLPRPYLHGYRRTPEHRPVDVSTEFSASYFGPSGGVVSTPLELNRFIRGYVGRELFSIGTQRRQFTFIPGSSDPPGPGRNSAGLGIFRYQTACGTVYGHTGSLPGYTQFAAASRSGRDSVTVSATEQLNHAVQPRVFKALRQVYALAVCHVLR
jgi:D-alanyl-D-alanine carboxypeptidase